MSYYLAAPLYVGGFVGLMWLLVHGIDALDRWGRKAYPSLIIVPECETSNVVVLDERRAS